VNGRRKRFYRDVSVTGVKNGFAVQLDGCPLKTPGKLPLVTGLEHVADLIAREWDAQEDIIRPETMPVTRLVNVTIELTPGNRGQLVAQARSYGETDLLCYRAKAPRTLVDRQTDQWDPVLKWAESQGISLDTTQSVHAVTQPGASLERVAGYTSGLADLELTLFSHLTAVFGSVVLAMAVMDKHINGDEAFILSRLDIDYQIENWGEDADAAENARKLRAEINALCKIIRGKNS